MQLTNQITATADQIKALIKDYPKDTPVAMVNLLKFKEKTDQGNESGQDAFRRYFENMQPLLAKAEAKVIWSGYVQNTVIGGDDNQPDMVAVVEYPSVQHFVDLAMSPEYQTVKNDREIALTYGGLLASQTTVKS
ncbi:DUF1330 domain-containing protein [uncultured Microscilla sp.]|uniref:DUF1330 domain-containing protein n=1 Tax=uncultured Microscilla sp. TaxID=432653 RepID=UPI002626569F|nr:DUF1330 domain-containing protein [uncultured Microscilla sp.]